MRNKTDKELIKLIKDKNNKAILFLRKEYEPMIKYMILNFRYSDGNNSVSAVLSDTEDLLHDAFYILTDKIFNKKFELTSQLSTYFYAVAKNLLKLKLRKKLLEKSKNTYNADFEYNLSQGNKTDYLYDENLKRKAFDYYYKQLSEVCQKILNLYWLEYSVKEISETIGYTDNYIMKRKYECTNRLIKLIKKNADQLDF